MKSTSALCLFSALAVTFASQMLYAANDLNPDSDKIQFQACQGKGIKFTPLKENPDFVHFGTSQNADTLCHQTIGERFENNYQIEQALIDQKLLPNAPATKFLRLVQAKFKQKILQGLEPAEISLYCLSEPKPNSAKAFYDQNKLFGPMFSANSNPDLDANRRFETMKTKIKDCGIVKSALVQQISSRLSKMRIALMLKGAEFSGEKGKIQIELSMPERHFPSWFFESPFPLIEKPQTCVKPEATSLKIPKVFVDPFPKAQACGEYFKAREQLFTELASLKDKTYGERLNKIKAFHEQEYEQLVSELPLLLYMGKSADSKGIAQGLSRFLRNTQKTFSQNYDLNELADLATTLEKGTNHIGSNAAEEVLSQFPQFCGVAQTWLNQVAIQRKFQDRLSKAIDMGVLGACFMSGGACALGVVASSAVNVVTTIETREHQKTLLPLKVVATDVGSAATPEGLGEEIQNQQEADMTVGMEAAVSGLFVLPQAKGLLKKLPKAKQGRSWSNILFTPLLFMDQTNDQNIPSVCKPIAASNVLNSVEEWWYGGHDNKACMQDILSRYGKNLEPDLLKYEKELHDSGTLADPVQEKLVFQRMFRRFAFRDLLTDAYIQKTAEVSDRYQQLCQAPPFSNLNPEAQKAAFESVRQFGIEVLNKEFKSSNSLAYLNHNLEEVKKAACQAGTPKYEVLQNVIMTQVILYIKSGIVDNLPKEYAVKDMDEFKKELKKVLNPKIDADPTQADKPVTVPALRVGMDRLLIEKLVFKMRNSKGELESFNLMLNNPNNKEANLKAYFREKIGIAPSDEAIQMLTRDLANQGYLKGYFDYDLLLNGMLKIARRNNIERLP